MNNFVYFWLLVVYLQSDILGVGLLDQKVNAHVVLLDIAKFSSIRVALLFVPTMNGSACFPPVLPNVDLLDMVIRAYSSFQWLGRVIS